MVVYSYFRLFCEKKPVQTEHEGFKVHLKHFLVKRERQKGLQDSMYFLFKRTRIYRSTDLKVLLSLVPGKEASKATSCDGKPSQ